MGGVSLAGCSLYSKQAFINSGILWSPPALHRGVFPADQGKKVSNQGKKGAKSNIYLLVFVLPRENRRPKGAKFKIYLGFEGCRGFRCGSLFVAVVVSTGGRWSGNSCYFADVSKIGQNNARRSAFCLLSRFVLGVLALKYAFIRVLRAFLARFVGFVWVCVACVLCVACGAFVCVSG